MEFSGPALYRYFTNRDELMTELISEAPNIALVEAAAGENGDGLRTAFSDAIVYCEAGEGQAFLARQDGAIAVFSSLRALRHGLGDIRWFAAIGTDLLQLLPDGCTFVLDPRSPHEA